MILKSSRLDPCAIRVYVRRSPPPSYFIATVFQNVRIGNVL